jgi:hypothetical protein
MLSCVSYFDAGIDIEPDRFTDVLAISYRDSLYVIEELIDFPAMSQSSTSRPHTPPLPYSDSTGLRVPMRIRRLAGNIGKPGLALLRSPQNLEVAANDLQPDQWKLVSQRDFDGKLENNFGDISLHLTLTGAEEPLSRLSRGNRLVDALYIEAAVSVLCRGEWMADIDILDLYSDTRSELKFESRASWLTPRLLPSHCSHLTELRNDPGVATVTAIDNWYEFDDPPSNAAVVRARGNWSARLALAYMMKLKQMKAMISTDQLCWECVRDLALQLSIGLNEVMILL